MLGDQWELRVLACVRGQGMRRQMRDALETLLMTQNGDEAGKSSGGAPLWSPVQDNGVGAGAGRGAFGMLMSSLQGLVGLKGGSGAERGLKVQRERRRAGQGGGRFAPYPGKMPRRQNPLGKHTHTHTQHTRTTTKNLALSWRLPRARCCTERAAYLRGTGIPSRNVCASLMYDSLPCLESWVSFYGSQMRRVCTIPGAVGAVGRTSSRQSHAARPERGQGARGAVRQSWLYEDVLQVLQGLKAKKGGLKALSLAPNIRRKAATLVPHLLCPRVPAPLTET